MFLSHPFAESLHQGSRNRFRLFCLEIHAHHHRLCQRTNLLLCLVEEYLLHCETFFSDMRDTGAHFDVVGKEYLAMKCAIYVGYDRFDPSPVVELTTKRVVELCLSHVEKSELGVVVDMTEDVDVVKPQLNRSRVPKHFRR